MKIHKDLEAHMSEFRFAKKHREKKPIFYRYWVFYFILATICFVGLFAWSERDIEMQQPSDDWSIGYEVKTNLPDDYRLMSQTSLSNDQGYALAYLDQPNQVVKLECFDWFGHSTHQAEIAQDHLKIPYNDIMVVQVSEYEGQLYVYYSDRKVLYRLALDLKTFDEKSHELLTENAEFFDVEGAYVLSGNNEETHLYQGTEVLMSYNDYEDLTNVVLEVNNEVAYCGINSYEKGVVLIHSDDNENAVIDIEDEVSTKFYGYFKDIHVENGLITVMSSKYNHLSAGAPTLMGVWQYNEQTLEPKPLKLFYHVKTSLNPIITHVENDQISYILGTQQTIDKASKGLSRYPQTNGGIFTNVSLFTRDGDVLVENTRLTMTRKYPIGYEYYTRENGVNQITWCDRYADTSTLVMAGQGEAWIKYAKENFRMGLSSLLSAAALAIGNTIFFGVISWLISLSPFFKYIALAGVILYLFNRFSKISRERKHAIVMYMMIAVFSVTKLIMIAAPKSDYRMFAHIYPWLFGNTVILAVTSIGTSLLSLLIFKLWQKQHYYYTNRVSQFFMFFGFDMYFFMLSIMAFFISALMKNNFML